MTISAVTVKFRQLPVAAGNPVYAFLCEGLELNTGDVVVVDANGAPQIAYVESNAPTQEQALKAVKYVIGKVDMEVHQKRLQRLAERKALKSRLDTKIKAFAKDDLIKLLCAADPEAAALVQQLEELA